MCESSDQNKLMSPRPPSETNKSPLDSKLLKSMLPLLHILLEIRVSLCRQQSGGKNLEFGGLCSAAQVKSRPGCTCRCSFLFFLYYPSCFMYFSYLFVQNVEPKDVLFLFQCGLLIGPPIVWRLCTATEGIISQLYMAHSTVQLSNGCTLWEWTHEHKGLCKTFNGNSSQRTGG